MEVLANAINNTLGKIDMSRWKEICYGVGLILMIALAWALVDIAAGIWTR